MIIGVGGAGCNMAETFKRKAKSAEIRDAQYVFVDVDVHKEHGDNDGRILVNVPDLFPKEDFLNGIKKLYILAGLGGDVGSYMAIFFAILSKLLAKVDYIAAVVMTPFPFEGDDRMKKALRIMEALKSLNLDLIIAFDNEKLSEKLGDLDVATAFNLADKEALAAIEGSIEPTL